MLNADLIAAYCRTTYRIHPAVGPLDLRLGVFHAGFDHWLRESGVTSWAVVTAFNPGSIQQPDSINQAAQQRLRTVVASRGWTAISGESIADDGDWPTEANLLILIIRLADAIALASEFGQTALLVGVAGSPPCLRFCTSEPSDLVTALDQLIAAGNPLASAVAAESLAALVENRKEPRVQLLPVFVYGTLKQGQCRQHAWPHAPLRIESAWTRGQLHNLGSYPALMEGNDQVQGELWHLAPEDLPRTLTVLDEIEGFSGGTDDLYHRRIVDCFTETDVFPAFTYVFANPSQLAAHSRIMPNQEGKSEW